MRTLLLTEAGGVTGKSIRKLVLLHDLIDKLTNHRMLTGADEVEILALYLVHHGIHLGETHYTRNHI